MHPHIAPVPASKRPGDPADTSSNKEERAYQDPGETSENIGIADSGRRRSRLDVSQEDRVRAIKRAWDGHLGMAELLRLYGDYGGTHLARKISDTKPLRLLGPKTAYGSQGGVGPVSIAQHEAGAHRAGSDEFWTMNGNGLEEFPIVNLSSMV